MTDSPNQTVMQAAPTRLLDRLMWRRNADGEWEHRLAREFNGDCDATVLWSNYDLATLDTRYTDLSCGVTWTHWALGPSIETMHEWPYVPAAGRSLPTRRTYVTLTLGPFYLTLHVLRPRKGFDPADDVQTRDDRGSEPTR